MGVYKCPVCEGRGFVSRDFYISQNSYGTTNSTATETCRSCGGKGIVFDAELFSGSCYGHAGPAIVHEGDPGYMPMTFVAKGTCSNCEHNDRICYISNPPKWKCTLDNKYHTADYRCQHWAEQQQKLLQGEPGIFHWMGVDLAVTPRTDMTKLDSMTRLNATGTGDTTIEGLTKSNSID